MSSSVPIPAGKRKAAASSSYSSSPSTPSSSLSSASFTSTLSGSLSSKGKAPISSSPPETISPRRPSLLGSSLAKSEHTVLNTGRSDGPLHLVSFVKSSQGFDWNQDIFLSSRDNYDGANELELRQDPVEDIVLTDEEADAMLPQ